MIIGYYNTWYQQQATHPLLAEFSEEVLKKGPLISIVVPAYNTPRRYLDELVYSVIAQAYENWELLLVNASDNKKMGSYIDACTEKDSRIRTIKVDNLGISANTNAGIAVAKGPYIAFCDHDDVLDPAALYEVGKRILETGAEFVYTDEDKISENGEVSFDPHFKPDWSPDLLTHVNYINHLSVIKRTLLDKVGLLNPEKDGAQDYDLLLRVAAQNPKIEHVAKVLYHWRAALNSTASDFSSKKNITKAAKNSLETYFKSQGTNVQVEPKEDRPGFYELAFQTPKKVTVVITPFASNALVRLAAQIVIDRSSAEGMAVEFLVPAGVAVKTDKKGITITTVSASKKSYLQEALTAAHGERIIVISQVAVPQEDTWVRDLCGPLQLPHIKTVAPVIVRDGNVIDDCGIVIDAKGTMISLFKDQPAFNNQTFFGNTDWSRNVDAVSGAVVAVNKAVLLAYLKTTKETDPARQLQKFSLTKNEKSNFNMIYAQTILDSQSIRLAPAHAKQGLFSPNLFTSSDNYEPYTPESAAINILTKFADHEEHP